MQFFSLFIKAAPNRCVFSIMLGALAGICYSALIPLVMVSIKPSDPNFPEQVVATTTFFSFEVANAPLAMVFLCACLLILFSRSLSEIMLQHIGVDVAKQLRKNLYSVISKASIAKLEETGSSKLITAINIDVTRIIAGANMIPAIFINLITLIGMLGFLMFLNQEVFQIVIISIVSGIFVYQIPMMFSRRIFESNRETRDELQESIRGLIYGAKELKLDDKKRNSYYDKTLLHFEDKLARTSKKGITVVRSTVIFGDLLSFFVIGGVAYIFINYYQINKEDLVGVVMALLYVTTPIAIILNSTPTLLISKVSFRKLYKLINELSPEQVQYDFSESLKWEQVIFKDVKYQYKSNDAEKGFDVGHINLTINKGEITFITGGNGSGKSTLSKLITQHYLPTQGEIFFGKHKITTENVVCCRRDIYAIYTNYFLFNQLLIKLTPDKKEMINEYLKHLGLSEKVSIKDGEFSTTKLSDGQRKRLALLVGLVEDKQLYLFDEVAADQDPEFKKFFYEVILNRLKSQGKAVVVISHDEQYFNVADHLLKMDSGQITKMNLNNPISFQNPQIA